jgi:hypothetical protein
MTDINRIHYRFLGLPSDAVRVLESMPEQDAERCIDWVLDSAKQGLGDRPTLFWYWQYEVVQGRWVGGYR